MKLLSSLSFLSRVALVGVLASPAIIVTPALAQQQTLDQLDFDNAQKAVDAGKLEEAAGLYEGIPVKYPTSTLIPQASLRLGYVYFRLLQYDKAVKTLTGVTQLKNVPPELAELAMSLVPQALSAKAIAEGAKSPQRNKMFDEAIKGFDAFLAKYPQSDEVESANYGKAVALYQTEKFDDALLPLKSNLKSFSQSASVLDSQYLFALTMATIASNLAAKEPPDQKEPNPAIKTNYDFAEQNLNLIIQGNDVALANDSRFQIGELRFSRAGFMKDKAAQKAVYLSSLESYRLVMGKDLVVAAQKARIERFKQARIPAIQQRDERRVKALNRAVEKEQEKLAGIEGRPDQTLLAKIKMAEVFYQLDRMDETRVMLSAVKPLVEDEEQKKTIAYFTAVSLARQNADLKGTVGPLAARAEAVYKEFSTSYGRDPIGENLPLLLEAAFVDTKPEKAQEYFDELRSTFPSSKLIPTGEALLAASLIAQGKFDEALRIFDETLKRNPTKEQAAAAKFGKATVFQKQKLAEQALPLFKDVRDNYPGTEQSVQASFYYPQLLVESGKFKEGEPELQTFVKNNPKNKLMPTALFFLAQAQAGSKKSNEALTTYKRVADEFPESEVAPYSYFQRAQILMLETKPDEDGVIALMQEYMDKYPNSPTLYQAYDFVAQIQISRQSKLEGKTEEEKSKGKIEAIGTYEKFVSLKAQDPMAAQALLKVGTLWKEVAEGWGRYILIKEENRATWQKQLENSIGTGERVVRQYPESPQVALALALLLDDQKLRVSAKLASDADVESYFEKLSDEFKDKPSTRSKVIFTLAGNLIEKDKAKALKLMEGVYDPKLKYAPEDMDLFGTGLIDEKKYPEATALFEKLGKDYKTTEGKETEAPREIQEAQSIVLFGLGKILQDQGQIAEAKVKFDELEKYYGWSPKMLAAHYGIAKALFAEKKYDEALDRLKKIANAPKAPPELRARAMFLIAECHEAKGNYDDAINNFIKIPNFYASVPAVASEGLWRGAQLLEKQAKGEIVIPTPVPKLVPVKKPAPGASGAPAAPAAPAAAPATAAK